MELHTVSLIINRRSMKNLDVQGPVQHNIAFVSYLFLMKPCKQINTQTKKLCISQLCAKV